MPQGQYSNQVIKAPTKVYLNDASVILFKHGYHSDSLSLYGYGLGESIALDGQENDVTNIVIPLDNIAAVQYYKEDQNAGQSFGSFLYVATTIFLVPISLYCLSCPKCCFGSCPTVYTRNNTVYDLQAELFSYNISELRQKPDLDKISVPDGDFELNLTNEALETHYINQMNLYAVYHPEKTTVFTHARQSICID